MGDWINLVEAGYRLDLEWDEWLENILETSVPLLDRGAGVNAQVFRVSATRFSLDHVALHGPGTPEMLRAFIENGPPDIIDVIYRRGIPVGTLSEWFFPDVTADCERWFVENSPGNLQDSFGMVAHSGTGTGLVLTAPLPRPRHSGMPERKRWSRIAAHLAAGLRLREHLATLDLDSERVEAIITPEGHIEHARANTKPASIRERLRLAVKNSDSARSRTARQNPDAALELWQGLVDGRWSLVDHFDSDQRRFIVAVKNDPEMPDPRGLSARERQVAEFFGMQRGVKEIGYIFGLSPSTVAHTLSRVQRKLELDSKSELAAFFSPSGMRARLAEVEFASENIAVGSQPLTDSRALAPLTDAEREVAIMLMQGATYATIAGSRNTSEHTIANQVQAIYGKLGVRSRTELAARAAPDHRRSGTETTDRRLTTTDEGTTGSERLIFVSADGRLLQKPS